MDKLKNIKTDCKYNVGFSKLVSLADFQKSSVLLFATFDIMRRRFVGQEVVILSTLSFIVHKEA